MKIVVYCSSQEGLDKKYQQLAQQLGSWIGQNGHTLLYGGSNAGLMHITATAAHEAGGHVIGVIPEMFRHRIDPVCNEVVYTANLGDRKQYMIEHGDAFIVMPGGIGTLDEWMSTLAVMTIGNDDPRPIIVANLDGLYDATIRQLAEMTRTPFARGKNLARTLNATTATEFLATLQSLNN
ncbi:MAG: TIGR00730 family Rossman fold protein [Muribaculaceae bacterium]|nr:TIGR00730 family Rossman fold protein [Muribaculaceae bacterium]